jgi:hypothetical protein
MAISRMQQPRQMYGLGSLVKKAVKGVTGAVKSIVKSPIGKAAILGAGIYGLSGGAGLGSLFGKAKTFLGGLPGAEAIGNYLGTKGGKTLLMAGAGSLLGGLAAKAEQGDSEAVAATRDVGALRNYLTEGYRNLGYTEDEIPQLVEQGVSEYTSGQGAYATGGRAGFKGGGMDASKADFKNVTRPTTAQTKENEYTSLRYTSPGGEKNMAMDRQPQPKFRPQFGPQFRPQFGPQFGPQLFNYQGLGVTPFNFTNENFAKLVGPALIQYRILQKKQAMEPLGGDPFTPQDQNMLDKLNQMNEEEKIYSLPITAANGGRIGYAFGNPEDNAMRASGIMNLPLNQNPAGVTELDLRDSGGFIPPVGVKEKADDIPAMLSNNEFVFTAESVRNMGNGDVNKGAQRMYDMMKYLEKGGRV